MANGRKSRLQRKAARLAKTDAERTFETELGAAKRERDETLAVASRDYRKGVDELREKRAATQNDAWRKFNDERNDLIRKHAAVEATAA